MERQNIGISGSSLKVIAVAAMLIDHIAAVVLARYLISGRGMLSAEWYELYRVMRNIGRIAFPIYCFLLVEGFTHTRDQRKYALRLFLFALLSEIPFDLAFQSKVIETGYQNVFFTLFLGLLTIMAMAEAEKRIDGKLPRGLVDAVLIVAGMLAAYALQTDYSYYGVMCIAALYLFRGNRLLQILAGCLAFFWWELPAVAAFVPIYFYNGKRGSNIKYFFYVFYPAHLMILYVICVLLGIDGVPAI